MEAVVAAFNQEKALVGVFSVIMNLRMELFQALLTVAHAARRASAAHSTLRPQPVPSTAASSHPARTQHTPTQPSFIVFGEGLLIDEMKAPSSAFPRN